MSFNKSRPDKSDSSQYRKVGQSGSFSSRNNNYSSSTGKGGGVAAPPPSSNLQTNRSFSKKSTNAKGGQPGTSRFSVNSSSDPNTSPAHRPAPNGSHFQPPVSAPRAPDTSTVAQGGLKAPSSQTANVKPGPAPHETPTKAPGDTSKAFPIQFGSVSLGTLNVMQIPARTNSAPPNLVEQQRDQARQNSSRQAPPVQIPIVPKQQQIPRKDEDKKVEAHQIPKPRSENQVPSPALINQPPKAPIINISGISMPMQFHQQQVPVQFRGPTPQQIQMPQPVYVPGLHHPMHAQVIFHQPQGLNYTAQMGPQMPPPQFPQIQSSKFVPSRKPIKITHPDTHEELRLENASVPSARPINNYPNNAFYSAQGQPPPRFAANINPSNKPSSLVSFNVTIKPPSNSFSVEKGVSEKKGEDSSIIQSTENRNKVTITAPDFIKDEVKKQNMEGSSQPSRQVPGQSTVSCFPSQSLEPASSFSRVTSEISVSSGEDIGTKEDKILEERAKKDENNLKTPTESAVLASPEVANQTEMKSDMKVETNSLEEDLLNIHEKDNSLVSSSASLAPDANNSTSTVNTFTSSDDGVVSISVIESPKLNPKTEKEGAEDVKSGLVSLPAASGEEGPIAELTRSKSSIAKGKKKRKGILQKADAAGTTSDLYNAYKGQEKIEIVPTLENNNLKKELVEEVHLSEKDKIGKTELDDWEDSLDISTLKIESPNNEITSLMAKKYTREFLLKFSEHFTDLPEGFEITSDVGDALMAPNINASRESYPSPGRVVPRSPGRPESRWNKIIPGNLKIEGNIRPGQGGYQGVSRNSRGGILSVPIQKSYSDADRWQRGTGYQKGLIPSPQTPAPVMHKAERKYERGIITDEEQAKQRTLKAILNKLTPQNFEKLFEQVKEVNIDNAGTLTGVISQIFDKALMEPTFCEMYANFCYYLAGELPDFTEDNEKISFKRILLNKCQEEFERGEREQEEADRADAEGEVKQSPEVREEKRIQARRRMLGNIRLIGELYKKRMLTERIMHECIKKLLGQYQNPDEEDIESLCKLMSTIGEMIDHPKAKEHMDAYFDMMSRLSNNMKLSSRVRFMLKDAIDLRKNKWQQRRKIEGPKKIDEVHRDAAQERNVQTSRLSRGPGPGPGLGRSHQPVDYSSRGSNILSSPNIQTGNYRGMQSQSRGFDDRHFESRTLSLQRPLGEETIKLGPQGGLARGMASRGQVSAPLVEGPPSIGERRVGSSLNRSSNRSRPGSPNVVPAQNVSSDKVWPEERLREMSLSTIKEFYSAKDEKEVALCVKDLNNPSFYPTMISLWVSDSFERKDMERDSLAKLLTSLSKSQDSLLNHDHIVKGFESVLSNLDDAVNDAPKAGEFLGRIFAKIIIEYVISFSEIGQLVFEGGEEQGSLVEVGLAAEIVGTILEIVKSEKGESFLNEICTSSGSTLKRFRPPNSNKPLRLDKFI